METVPAKHLIYKNQKPAYWFGCDYNMNIYRGCNYGCIYCDSRSDCYQNPDFDRVKVKEDALRIIRDDLKSKSFKGVVGTGAMSDPYNPYEKGLKLTRNALELINAYGFGVGIDTKSPLATRDIDVLGDIKKHSPVIIKVTITTFDDALCKKVEPGVAVSSARFEALKQLADAGIFCGVLMMPLLPFINDTKENIEGILVNAKKAGAKFVYPAIGMTLRQGNREYYYKKLDTLFPGQGLTEKYMKTYGSRYEVTSPKVKSLWPFFVDTCQKLGLMHDMKIIISAYKIGYGHSQLSFL